ncbi:MAG: ABC transporter substrate-binding protein [Aureispira sp.]
MTCSNYKFFNGLYLLASGLFLVLFSCGNSNIEQPETTTPVPKDFTVKISIKDNPDGLNVLLAQSGIASEILDYNVHGGLMEIDPQNVSTFRPYLAKAHPKVENIDGDRVAYHYEIRPEAVWDNGTPITAEDYIFSIKAIKNPKTNASAQRPFLECIQDVIVDPTDPKKFTVISSLYHVAEVSISTISILPSYHYDPQGLMENFTLTELNDPSQLERLMADQRIADFAEEFNNNYNLEAEAIKGAGPYQITEILANQHIKLERKSEWWGDQVDEPHIAAYPTSLLFRVLSDDNNAILSLKEQELDVMTYIPEEKFVELQNDERTSKNFELQASDGFAYRYIGMNMKSPQLTDVRVRRALAHLVDKEYIAKDLANGFATTVNGPVSPLKAHYNKNITTIPFDVEKASALLAEAGWKDTDGDNILDKTIDGEVVKLSLKMLYPKGKQFYKDVSQILKDEAIRVGIDIQLVSAELAVIIQRLKKRDFDLMILAWGQSPTLDDFKQIWHTESDTYEGNNMVGFGNEETDQLIETIRVTIDETARTALYMRFQEIVAEQQPYVFLVAPKLCSAIHKRFKNAPAVSLRPGYFVRLFQLDEHYKQVQ